MLTIKNITTIINQHTILRTINATAEPGDIILVVGQNGSGKSTLLNVIAGTLTPKSGSIIINMRDITRWNERQRASIISRLYQNPSMNTANTLTVAQNLALARLKNKHATLRNGLSKNDTIANDLRPLLHKRMHDLSGGQRQLIAFKMATTTQPPILLLDEPTAALDQQATITLLDHINQQAHTKKTITIMVTHELEYITKFGNKIWILNNGSLHSIDKNKNTVSLGMIKEMIRINH